MAILSTVNSRQQQLQQWLEQLSIVTLPTNLILLAQGASSRRFFRFYDKTQSYIVMDSPPSEDTQHYVKVARLLAKSDICVPQILAQNFEDGFVLMSDLGDKLLYQELKKGNADQLYHSAMDALLCLQRANLQLPSFDATTMTIGLQGFRQIVMQKYLMRKLSPATEKILQHCFNTLINNALIQPQIPMHRDYHSQNLLVFNKNIGMVDFQDAKIGPITYDLVSLLRDCYVDWSDDKVNSYRDYFYYQLHEQELLHKNVSVAQFTQWFDWMGIKRHLKSCFTFANKWIRDQDRTYLCYLPSTLNHIHLISERYNEFKDFITVFEQEVLAYVPPITNQHQENSTET